MMDLTFCAHCESGLCPDDFPYLWKRVMASWAVEAPDHPWLASQKAAAQTSQNAGQ